jgi:hypothetical protein
MFYWPYWLPHPVAEAGPPALILDVGNIEGQK